MILPLLLSSLFFALALLHFYWAFGGKLGFEAALPTKEKGEKVMHPKPTDSVMVGIGLSAFGLFYVLLSGLMTLAAPHRLTTYGAWIIPGVFFLRAIGEFRYVGFFKSVRQTAFGKLDTQLLSPLCLLIAAAGILIQLL